MAVYAALIFRLFALGMTVVETLNKIIRHEIQIKGSWSSVIEPHNEWEESLYMMKNKKLEIKNLISHNFKFSDAPTLFKSMYKKEFKFSKVILSL